MNFIGVTRYKDTVEKLESKIRKGEVQILDEKAFSGRHAHSSKLGYCCYFCGEHIYGEAKILVEEDSVNGHISFNYFPVDDECYRLAVELSKTD